MRNIFVSSTFQDMQAERDIIRQKVFPAINKVAACHNDHIEFIDLRWGIDTLKQSEQEASIKIMSVCLNELRRSDDLMIILLGDRYGWTPDIAYLRNLQRIWDIVSIREQMSATAFEIEHGVFHGNKRALVYFRKLENIGVTDIPGFYFEQNSENRKHLEKLKNRLRKNSRCKVQEYSVHFKDGTIEQDDMDAFARRLKEDLEKELAEKWEEFDQLSNFDQEQEIQWGFIQQKAEGFCARGREIDLLMSKIQSWSNGSKCKNQNVFSKNFVHFIIGSSGSGKSTMLSKLAVCLRQEGRDVLPFIGGLTMDSNDTIRVLNNIVYYIEEQLEIDHQVKFGVDEARYVTKKELGESVAQGHTSIATLNRQKLQKRLEEVAEQYVDGHSPLIVLIDALDQFYPDENRDDLVFCSPKLNGNVQFIITCTPEIKTKAVDKTILKKLKGDDQLLTIRSALKYRHKEISEEVISELLKSKGTENPLYISMVMDGLMLMDQKDFCLINRQGGQSDAIASYQKNLIAFFPEDLSEMAVSLFEKSGEIIGKPFTQKALEYIAISRQGLRESDLAYCMGKDWDSTSFSNLMFYLNDQFLIHADGRIDFTHKVLRQGVLSKIQNAEAMAMHLKLEWCYHEREVEDSVRASEILYHCFCRNEYKYAASVVYPIVYQNFSSDKDVLKETSRRYAQTIAELAMSDRGEWVQKWLCFLADDAKTSKNNKDLESRKWDALWKVLWFLNRFVLCELPYTQSGNETGGAITMYMLAVLNDAGNGSWTEEYYQYVKDETQNSFANYQIIAGRLWEAQIVYKKIFKETQIHYESLEEKDYTSWREMFEAGYSWLFSLKGSSDHNILIAALEPAAYGISLLSEKSYVSKYINEENCFIGQFYGSIGEVCGRLFNFDANLLAYEQDLRYREEIYSRSHSVTALLCYAGSYHNISQIYLNLGTNVEKRLEKLYTDEPLFYTNTNHPLKLLPIIRFASSSEKTIGEIFMDRCHAEPPVIASLLAKDREIELLEIALEMNSDIKKVKIYNSGLQNSNSIWDKYLSYSILYFEILRGYWNPMDKSQSTLFNRDKIQSALYRLCNALEYCWYSFFNDPTEDNARNILSIGKIFFNVRNYIGMDGSGEIFTVFNQCIHKAEEFLKGCIEQDSAEEAKSDGTEWARWILVNSCLLYSQIACMVNHSKQDEDMICQWCTIGSSICIDPDYLPDEIKSILHIYTTLKMNQFDKKRLLENEDNLQ